MDEKLARLGEIGFVRIGHWTAEGLGIAYELHDLANASNVLYAFAVEGQLKYIGKTTTPLRSRLNGYKNPSKSSSTNIKNKRKIRACLDQARQVEIFALRDSGLLSFGGFHLNLAAGLEDSLVRELDPPWNGGEKEGDDQSLHPTKPVSTILDPTLPPAVSPPPDTNSSRAEYSDHQEPAAEDFRSALHAIFAKASEHNGPHIEVVSGELHRQVGGSKRMPTCCSVMRGEMQAGDALITEPPKGNGSTLRVRYVVPRPRRESSARGQT